MQEETKQREGHNKILTKRLIANEKTLIELVEEGEITILELPKWEQGLACYNKLKLQNNPDLPEMWPVNPRWNITIVREPVTEKLRHLYVYSNAFNLGKTWFLEHLKQNYRAHYMSSKEKY